MTDPSTPQERLAAQLLHGFLGLPYSRIAHLLGRGRITIATWCDPLRRANVRAATARYEARLREQGLPRRRLETIQRRRIRAMARKEAKATGKDVEILYKRWGVGEENNLTLQEARLAAIAKRKERSYAEGLRQKLRREARAQALRTGEDLEALYASWGVKTLKKSGKYISQEFLA